MTTAHQRATPRRDTARCRRSIREAAGAWGMSQAGTLASLGVGVPAAPSVLAFVLLVAIAIVAAIDGYAAPESSKPLLTGTLFETTVNVLHAIQD